MADRVTRRLSELGINLPRPFSAPPGMEFGFEPARISGSLIHISGHGPLDGSDMLLRGKVGGELDLQQGYEAARLTGLSILATLAQVLGDLDRVSGWVKALGFVNCAPGFDATPAVINGFSDLVVELWGDDGRHARSAIGVAELPFGIPVEVEAVAEIR
jgi:enamine deaminase RidA (YjgF/YER057c/UK114 family)